MKSVVHCQTQSKAIDLVYALCETLLWAEAGILIEEFVLELLSIHKDVLIFYHSFASEYFADELR